MGVIRPMLTLMVYAILLRGAMIMIRQPEEMTWIGPFKKNAYVNEIYLNRKTNPYYHKQIRKMGYYIIVGLLTSIVLSIIRII